MSEGSSFVGLQGVGHAWRPDEYLFRDLDYILRPGRRTGIIGPSGSGKSTLLSIIADMQVPSEGRRYTLGGSQAAIRWVFQNPQGVPRRTALDHVVLPILALGKGRTAAEETASDLMESFGIASLAERKYHQLSGGEQQRLLLCRAIAAKPELLLVDEPTAQLDQHSSKLVNDALSGLSVHADTAIVIATHDPQTMAACDELIDLSLYQES